MRIVRNHGGMIKRNEPGQGSCFEVLLPYGKCEKAGSQPFPCCASWVSDKEFWRRFTSSFNW